MPSLHRTLRLVLCVKVLSRVATRGFWTTDATHVKSLRAPSKSCTAYTIYNRQDNTWWCGDVHDKAEAVFASGSVDWAVAMAQRACRLAERIKARCRRKTIPQSARIELGPRKSECTLWHGGVSADALS